MVLGICLLIVIYILYVLLIKGLLWKIILGAFGWFGMYWYLKDMDGWKELVFRGSDTWTWAMVAPTVLLLLAMAYTKEE
jgi:hypothetical protein